MATEKQTAYVETDGSGRALKLECRLGCGGSYRHTGYLDYWSCNCGYLRQSEGLAEEQAKLAKK